MTHVRAFMYVSETGHLWVGSSLCEPLETVGLENLLNKALDLVFQHGYTERKANSVKELPG